MKKESASLPTPLEKQGTNCQNIYNIHHVLQNVKLSPNWAKIYYNPLLTGGYRVKFDPEHDSETLFNYNQNAFFLNNFENISIDKIVILLGAPAIGRPATFNFWRNFDLMIDWGTPEIMCVGGSLYKHSVKWCSDYFIQWECSQNKVETIRIEFNPNKADLQPLAAFFSVFKSHSLNFARITRLDVAIDYGMYINPLCWLVKNTPYSSRFEYNSMLKTRYFGSRSSDIQIRIYDKAFELKEHGIVDFDLKDFWRVEAQVKAIQGETFNLLDVAKVKNFNPFERLEFYDPYGGDYSGQGIFSLFVETALAKDISYALTQLAKNTKRKYLSMLKEQMCKQKFNAPAVIYKEVFGMVYQRFTDELQRLFDLGQSQGKLIFKDLEV